jgi:hypothetical protein
MSPMGRQSLLAPSRLLDDVPAIMRVAILTFFSLLSLLRQHNVDIPSTHSSPPSYEVASDIVGPITRSRAKQWEKEMHSQVNFWLPIQKYKLFKFFPCES